MDHFDEDAEALVKRTKKADLVAIIARLKREAMEQSHRYRSRHDAITKLQKECETLRDELSKLLNIRKAVQRVLNEYAAIDDKQLTLLLQECESGYNDDYKSMRAREIASTCDTGDEIKDAAQVLMNLLDACENDEGENDVPSYRLRDMLDIALCDRAELLAKLGLTDREWSARGGSCEADFNY